MHFNRFQQGDSVQYNGSKDSLRSLLNGKEGQVVARVQGDEGKVVVTFATNHGESAYILDESSDLSKFVKRDRPEVDQAKAGGPDVQKRRGVGEGGPKGKGGKRRNQEEG